VQACTSACREQIFEIQSSSSSRASDADDFTRVFASVLAKESARALTYCDVMTLPLTELAELLVRDSTYTKMQDHARQSFTSTCGIRAAVNAVSSLSSFRNLGKGKRTSGPSNDRNGGRISVIAQNNGKSNERLNGVAEV
jgi:hypothetical protein